MDDVTLGELARRMDLLHVDVKELRSAVVQRDDLAAVANGWQLLLQSQESKTDLQFQAMETRVSALESFQTWAVRIVLGAVLLAVIGLVLANPSAAFGR